MHCEKTHEPLLCWGPLQVTLSVICCKAKGIRKINSLIKLHVLQFEDGGKYIPITKMGFSEVEYLRQEDKPQHC